MKEITLSKVIGSTGIFIDGDWIESKDQDPNGDVRLIQLADIGDGDFLNKSRRFLTAQKAKELNCTYLKPGDLLIARMPDPLGRACIFPGDDKPCVTVVDVCIVRPDTSIASTQWLKYLINNPDFRNNINKYMTGATRQRISRSNLDKIKFKLLPFNDQTRIVMVLSKAEALIARRKESLQLLDNLLTGTFIEMFGDPVRNEKGWSQDRLENLCITISDIDHKMPKAVDEGYPFISAKDLLDNGTMSFDSVKRISKEDFDRLSRKIKPQRGDIIYSRIGANLGKARIVKVDLDFIASYSCCTIRPDTNKINTAFLAHLLDSPFILKRALKDVRAIGVPDLGMDKIRSFKIITPDPKLQTQFARTIEKVEALKAVYHSSLKELENLYGSLSQLAFKEELGLSKLDIDHIVPISAGGTDSIDNLALISAAGNKRKGNRLNPTSTEDHYRDLSSVIRSHFGPFEFRFNELIEFLQNDKKLPLVYFTSDEMIKKNVTPSSIDIKSFIFDCLEGKNKHLILEQFYYDALSDMNLSMIGFKKGKEEVLNKIKSKEISQEDLSGIYLRIG